MRTFKAWNSQFQFPHAWLQSSMLEVPGTLGFPQVISNCMANFPLRFMLLRKQQWCSSVCNKAKLCRDWGWSAVFPHSSALIRTPQGSQTWGVGFDPHWPGKGLISWAAPTERWKSCESRAPLGGIYYFIYFSDLLSGHWLLARSAAGEYGTTAVPSLYILLSLLWP